MTEVGSAHADDAPALLRALAATPDGGTLDLPGRELHLHATSCPARHLKPSNNLNGLKPVAFPLHRRNGLTIDGHGARLVFHGGVLPFWLGGCRDITLRNFSIDWHRPFYSQGVVTACDSDGVECAVDREKYPCRIGDGRLVFLGEGWASPLTHGIFEIDAATGAPACRSGDNLGTQLDAGALRALDIGGGRFRIPFRFRHEARVGNVLLLRHCHRHFPAVFMEHSRNVRIEDVQIHHSSAMGVIGQLCDHVSIERVVVGPAPGSGRLFSTAVDATHFVNCTGLIGLRDCRFSHQMDDPCNVHGLNLRFHVREDARTAVFERVHFEQWGAPFGLPGDRVQLSSNTSLLAYAELTIDAITDRDDRFLAIQCREPLPDRARAGDVLENLTRTPDFHVDNCDSGPNRARGFLVSTPGRVVIENSRISAPGAGIKISSDANYWFESGAVRDVTIRNNTFTDCCYGSPATFHAAIDINPEIDNPWAEPKKFHRNIRITANTFRAFEHGILYARSVDGITFSDNRVEWTHTHPPVGTVPAILNFDACSNISVHRNHIPPRGHTPEMVVNDTPPGIPQHGPRRSLADPPHDADAPAKRNTRRHDSC